MEHATAVTSRPAYINDVAVSTWKVSLGSIFMMVPGRGGLSFLIIASISPSFMSVIVDGALSEDVMTSSARMDERSDVIDACCCVEWWLGANDSAAFQKRAVARAPV